MAPKKKNPRKMQPQANQSPLNVLRIARVKTDGVDRENRSIPIVLATEEGVRAYDGRQMDVVDEVIDLAGMEMPRQIPMVDSHDRYSVRSVLGSIRELKVENGQLLGRAYFAGDETSRETFEKYADGHLTDFSVGAIEHSAEYDESQSPVRKTITKSELVEGSAVVAGADPNAKAIPAMRAYTDPEEMRKEAMNEELKKLLVEQGLPEDATDKQALEFIQRQLDSGKDDKETADKLEREKQELETRLERKEPSGKQTNEQEIERARKAERERIREINELCRGRDIPDDDVQRWLDEGASPDMVARKIVKFDNEKTTSKDHVGPEGIQFGRSEREKFYDAAEHGVLTRALSGYRLPEDIAKEVHGDKKPEGSEQFRYKRIPDIAREYCERAGMRVDGLPTHEVVRRAMQSERFVERGGTSFHTTGSFTNLFLNAMNKTLRAAYDEAPATYSRWVRQASSASDFKELNRIVFGEIGLPEEIGENQPYPEATASDQKESYRVRKHGQIFTITMEMMVNDDMDAMVRIPRMQGNAMRRGINRDAYSILTENAALADGIALFHASSHGANLDSNALEDDSDIDVGYTVMMTQSGLDSTSVLNIMPRYLIVPAALAATAYRITNAGVIPETTSNVPLYGPNGPRSLEVVVDGQLDTLGSTTGWYLAADNNVVDTVEITFLQGEESPVLDREDGFDTDVIKYKIRQTYGLKAIDYRGLYQGNS